MLFRREKDKKETINRPGRKRKKKVVFGIGAGIVLAGVIALRVRETHGAVPQILAAEVERGDIEAVVSVSGLVESEKFQIYYAPMAAKVSEMNVESGDAVKKGDVLLQYDTGDLEYKQRTDALDALASESSYQNSISESNRQRNIYNETAQSLEIAEQMIAAQRDFIHQLTYYIEDEKTKKKLALYDERYRLTRSLNGINLQLSIADEDDHPDSLRSAQADTENRITEINKKLEELDMNKELTAIERQIVEEQQKLADMEELKSQWKADNKTAENAVLTEYKRKELEAIAEKGRLSEEQARTHLDEALAGVRADFNGIITELDVYQGYVTEAGTKLMKLESSDDVRIRVFLSKYDLARVKLGQRADVTISGNVYEGRVSKINRMAERNDSGTRLVAAQIHIENPDDNIYLGIEGKADIHASKSENTLLVPIAAVNTDQEGDFCYVVKDGIVEMKRVRTGLSSESCIEIREGLSEEDVVLTDSSMEILEGMEAAPLIL